MIIERPFIAFTSEGRNVYINTAQIRQVVLSDDGLDIEFSETHKIHLDGVGAVRFAERLVDFGIALNGEPLTRSGMSPPASLEVPTRGA